MFDLYQVEIASSDALPQVGSDRFSSLFLLEEMMGRSSKESPD